MSLEKPRVRAPGIVDKPHDARVGKAPARVVDRTELLARQAACGFHREQGVSRKQLEDALRRRAFAHFPQLFAPHRIQLPENCEIVILDLPCGRDALRAKINPVINRERHFVAVDGLLLRIRQQAFAC